MQQAKERLSPLIIDAHPINNLGVAGLLDILRISYKSRKVEKMVHPTYLSFLRFPLKGGRLVCFVFPCKKGKVEK